jgi:WD40 repeat protein
LQVPRFLVGEELRAVRSVAVSLDGKFAVAGSDTGTVRLWNLKSQQAVLLSGHGSQITGVAYAPDATKVAASGMDGKVIIWDVVSKKEVQRWRMPGPVHAVTFADNQHLATANNSGNVYILRLEQTKE